MMCLSRNYCELADAWKKVLVRCTIVEINGPNRRQAQLLSSEL